MTVACSCVSVFATLRTTPKPITKKIVNSVRNTWSANFLTAGPCSVLASASQQRHLLNSLTDLLPFILVVSGFILEEIPDKAIYRKYYTILEYTKIY